MTPSLSLSSLLLMPAASINDRIADLVRRHHAAVLAVAYATVRDRAIAEDVAQETFVIGWQKLERGEQVRDVGPWLGGIARNLARNARRKHQRRAHHDASVSSAAPEITSSDVDDVCRKTLGVLSADQREALLLHYWGDQDVASIASELGVSTDTVKQRLSRGRARLRDALHEVDPALRKAAPTAAGIAAFLIAVDARRAAAAPLPSSASRMPYILGAGGLAIFAIGATAIAVHSTARDGASGGHASARQPSVARGASVPPAMNRTSSSSAPRASTLPGPSAPLTAPNHLMLKDPRVLTALSLKMDIELSAAPARDVIAMIADATEIPIWIDPAIDLSINIKVEATTVDQALDEIVAQVGGQANDTAGYRLVAGSDARCNNVPIGAPLAARTAPAALNVVVDSVAVGLGRPVFVPYDVYAVPQRLTNAGEVSPAPRVTVPPLPAMAARDVLVELLTRFHLGCEEVPGIRIVSDDE